MESNTSLLVDKQPPSQLLKMQKQLQLQQRNIKIQNDQLKEKEKALKEKEKLFSRRSDILDILASHEKDIKRLTLEKEHLQQLWQLARRRP